MTHRRVPLVPLLVAAALLGVALPAARAQDRPAPVPGGTAEGAGGAEEAEALVKRIQESLADVDAALAQAADAGTAADGVEAAKRKHLEVIRDIEALIKQIKYQQSNNPSSGGGGGKGKNDEKLSGKPPPQPSDGSQAPKPTGGKPDGQDGEQQKPGEEQGGEKKDSKPAGGGKDRTPGANEPASRPPPDETGKFTRTDTDARWGLLPPKLQERLMNLHVDDVPERYRAWLDAYIHALNSREQEGQTR